MLERKRQVLRKRLAQGVAWLHPFWRLPGRIRFLAFSSLYQLPTSLGSWHSSIVGPAAALHCISPPILVTPPATGPPTAGTGSSFLGTHNGIAPFSPGIIQDTLPMSRSSIKLQSPSPGKVTIKAPRIRVWALWGANTLPAMRLLRGWIPQSRASGFLTSGCKKPSGGARSLLRLTPSALMQERWDGARKLFP